MTKPGVRKSWPDCLKAFAILLVIYRHVYGFTFDCSDYADQTIIGALFPLIALPLFFFLSGYFSFKPQIFWRHSSNYINKIKKKFIQLILPTAVFYILLSEFVIKLPFPGGYWFTLVLFEMFILLYTLELGLNKVNNWLHDIVLIIVAIILFLIKNKVGNYTSPYFELGAMFEYNFYFMFGYMTRKYKNFILRNIKIDYLITSCLIILPLLFFIDVSGLLSSALIQIKRIVAVTLTVSLFYFYRDYFDKDYFTPTWLRLIGRRTLDLYMIHYFFLWPKVTFLEEILKNCHNQPLEIILIGGWMIVVLLMSLSVIKILRTSKFIIRYLLAG